MSTDFTSVSITKGMLSEIQRVIKDRSLGYRSPSEFVRDACREKISQIKDRKNKSKTHNSS